MSRLFRRRPLAGLAALVGLSLLAAGCSGGGSGSGAPGGHFRGGAGVGDKEAGGGASTADGVGWTGVASAA